jgi:hypothetical protein
MNIAILITSQASHSTQQLGFPMQPNSVLETTDFKGELAEFEITVSTTIKRSYQRGEKVTIIQSSKTVKIKRAPLEEKVVNIRESA